MQLSHDSIELWDVRLDISGAECRRLLGLLSEEEAAQASRLRIPDVRRRFVAARGALRSILSGYLVEDPSRIRLDVGPSGKPYLPDHASLHFNLSHSADACVCAVASSPLGVDIERVRPLRDMMRIAERFFTSDECRALAELPAGRRHAAFYACWTRKEAVVKALGLGVGPALEQFAVSVDPAVPAIVFSNLPGGGAEHWQLHNLPMPADFVGALAAAPGRRLLARAWSPPPATT